VLGWVYPCFIVMRFRGVRVGRGIGVGDFIGTGDFVQLVDTGGESFTTILDNDNLEGSFTTVFGCMHGTQNPSVASFFLVICNDAHGRQFLGQGIKFLLHSMNLFVLIWTWVVRACSIVVLAKPKMDFGG